MGRYVSTNAPEQNERDMLEVLGSVATGEVTIASRDAELDGIPIRAGHYLGLVDETAVAAAEDMAPVVEAVVARVLAGEREWLAILTGEGAPPLDGRSTRSSVIIQLVIEVHDGGRPTTRSFSSPVTSLDTRSACSSSRTMTSTASRSSFSCGESKASTSSERLSRLARLRSASRPERTSCRRLSAARCRRCGSCR